MSKLQLALQPQTMVPMSCSSLASPVIPGSPKASPVMPGALHYVKDDDAQSQESIDIRSDDSARDRARAKRHGEEPEQRGGKSAFNPGHGQPGEGLSRHDYEAARNLFPGNCPCIPCLWKAMTVHSHILLLRQEVANPATRFHLRNAMTQKLEQLIAIKDDADASALQARERAIGGRIEVLEAMGMISTWLLDTLLFNDMVAEGPGGTDSPPSPPECSDEDLEQAREAYLQAAKRRRLALRHEQQALDTMNAKYEADHEARNAKKGPAEPPTLKGMRK